MGHRIIRQPDGLLCVFSTGTDTIIVRDATADELADWYAERAAKSARESALDTCEQVLAGRARDIYCQFVMTYEEAVRMTAGEDDAAGG
jgi:hypothetical protein